MTRDYAKKPQKKSTVPGWLWMLAGLSVGLFVAFLVWLNGREGSGAWEQLKAQLPKPPVQQTAKKPAPKAEEKAAKKEESSKFHFDFYDILPEYEVPVPKDEQAEARAALPPARYILQAGSFQNARDAEARKAELALLGIVSSIQTVTINGTDTWHRVRIGPLEEPRKVHQVRALLRDNEIDCLLFKEKG